MATTNIDSKNNPQQKIEQLLKEVAELKVPDLNLFKKKFEQLFKQKKPLSYSKKEKQLIDKIKKGGPSKEWLSKYDQLSAKVTKETITSAEHEELLKMIPIAEKWTYERLKFMVELAELWEVSLDEVINRLKIEIRNNVYA